MIPATSLPATGSVTASPIIVLPPTTCGMYLAFCSSVPKSIIVSRPKNPETAQIPVPASTRQNSSCRTRMDQGFE